VKIPVRYGIYGGAVRRCPPDMVIVNWPASRCRHVARFDPALVEAEVVKDAIRKDVKSQPVSPFRVLDGEVMVRLRPGAVLPKTGPASILRRE